MGSIQVSGEPSTVTSIPRGVRNLLNQIQNPKPASPKQIQEDRLRVLDDQIAIQNDRLGLLSASMGSSKAYSAAVKQLQADEAKLAQDQNRLNFDLSTQKQNEGHGHKSSRPHPGFFGRIGSAISGFFSHLF